MNGTTMFRPGRAVRPYAKALGDAGASLGMTRIDRDATNAPHERTATTISATTKSSFDRADERSGAPDLTTIRPARPLDLAIVVKRSAGPTSPPILTVAEPLVLRSVRSRARCPINAAVPVRIAGGRRRWRNRDGGSSRTTTATRRGTPPRGGRRRSPATPLRTPANAARARTAPGKPFVCISPTANAPDHNHKTHRPIRRFMRYPKATLAVTTPSARARTHPGRKGRRSSSASRSR